MCNKALRNKIYRHSDVRRWREEEEEKEVNEKEQWNNSQYLQDNMNILNWESFEEFLVLLGQLLRYFTLINCSYP